MQVGTGLDEPTQQGHIADHGRNVQRRASVAIADVHARASGENPFDGGNVAPVNGGVQGRFAARLRIHVSAEPDEALNHRHLAAVAGKVEAVRKDACVEPGAGSQQFVETRDTPACGINQGRYTVVVDEVRIGAVGEKASDNVAIAVPDRLGQFGAHVVPYSTDPRSVGPSSHVTRQLLSQPATLTAFENCMAVLRNIADVAPG